jgi:predicted adenylyl cyclase CyaB
MPRNIEIKARIADRRSVEKRVARLADSGPEAIRQRDVFFHTRRGRLKLRIFDARHGELIYYERADRRGPMLSSYIRVETKRPAEMQAALSKAFGVRGIVRKRRRLYLVGNTRIHLDDVEGLGQFLELEMVLSGRQSPRAGRRVAERLMNRLGISKKSLLDGAYLDLILRGAGRRGRRGALVNRPTLGCGQRL